MKVADEHGSKWASMQIPHLSYFQEASAGLVHSE